MIGKKYTTSGFLIAFLIVIQFASTMVFAQTDTPIPTGDSDNDVINKLKQIETLKEQNPERWQRRLEKSQNARETEAIEKIAKGFKENPYFENYFETS